MRSFERLAAVSGALLLMLCILLNIVIFRGSSGDTEKLHMVEINRAEQEIIKGNVPDVSDYDTITKITAGSTEDFFNSSGDCVIRSIDGKLYRFDYKDETSGSSHPPVLKTELILGGFVVLYILVMLTIWRKIIRPFRRLSGLPDELARGNLTIPLKENKSRYFGKFVWGMNMLREELESSRARELEQNKEEHTLLLALSHDIKTPLSAIKLYSKAISGGLYTTPEKQAAAAVSISEKADEIEGYLSEMIGNLSGGSQPLEPIDGEFYLSEVIGRINAYYSDKLSTSGAALRTEEFTDCLLRGDADRLEEVLQNILENAVKYGDGRDISISFSDEEDCRLVTVTNTGCTLPQEELSHIFGSFWRGSNSAGKQGSGLGLFICRRLMNAMDGEVFAEMHDDKMSVTAVCRKI